VLEGRRDLVLLGARGVNATWLGRELAADAELVVLRVPEEGPAQVTVAGGSARWGDLSAEATVSEHALQAADADAGTLIVEGELGVEPGDVITLDHAGERVSAYTVVAAQPDGANTRLTLAEGPGITWDAATSTSTFVFVPHTSHQGAHVVRTAPVAHAREQ